MSLHLWLRAETRPDEGRVGLMPEGAAALIAAGAHVTVEDSHQRVIPTADYAQAGCPIVPAGSWPGAPAQAVIFGLKDLPDDGTPLIHNHIMFGHAYKGQPGGQALLARFRTGGGCLYDLEALTAADGARVAAFGYWAGFAGAAVALWCWLAQERGHRPAPLAGFESAMHLRMALQQDLIATGTARPTALIIGAAGRAGSGAAALCRDMGVASTLWDLAETAAGGPFPAVLAHDMFLNCIVARPGTPVFVPGSAKAAQRRLSVIGDIACDPASDFSPIRVNDRLTSWAAPARRVHAAPPLDVVAIDNLPSLLPAESSADFAAQLLPHLVAFCAAGAGADQTIWTRAQAAFRQAMGVPRPVLA